MCVLDTNAEKEIPPKSEMSYGVFQILKPNFRGEISDFCNICLGESPHFFFFLNQQLFQNLKFYFK